MVQIRKGISRKHASSQKLTAFFESNDFLNGVFYVGYPIIYAGGESTTIDALWVSPEYGVIVFDVIEESDYSDRQDIQDDLFSKISALLMPHKELVQNRTLAVDIEIITFAPAWNQFLVQDNEFKYALNESDLLLLIQQLKDWSTSAHYSKVVSVIQSITKLRSGVKRVNLVKADSKGSKLKRLEDTIANLDSTQEEAVIDYFEGVQRIRGLAGSGKTVVIALKAAYLHAQNPDLKIAVTFHSRALKKQFKELIERFCAEKTGGLPDWDNIHIIHAWGSPRTEGIYYDFCLENGVIYHDFPAARNYRSSHIVQMLHKTEFEAVCDKALKEADAATIKQKYDVILIDEAQDLSEAFLRMCYAILKSPKNLIYAYDELQRLNDSSSLGNPSKIFGIEEGEFHDTILYKCYRNSKPVLVTAHALGFGVYRNIPNPNKLVQLFDQPQLWQDVGYEIKAGALRPGENVQLRRTERSSPPYLESYLGNDSEDMLIFKKFASANTQAEWVAANILKNISEDELLHKDIVVINCRTLSTERDVSIIRSLLFDNQVTSHIAGASNADVFYEYNSITLTGIHRAKGNEVPMVYIINADECFSGKELIKKRNILFTAITRSKAWVRVCGIGANMTGLIDEYNKVKEHKFELHFEYPSAEAIKKMNIINRDMSIDEQKIIKKDSDALSNIKDIINRIKIGKSHIEDYPLELQEILKHLV
ncbi:DEAD/DEAH box helicase [Hymenobacter arizonensis]|uniref:DNA 3'-5' helicase II n=1 Tax=Hymenobacter arizonensis TaxID=1227077 RepID=A0A1I6BGE8_HYMAR|nr:ATP-binding domain-containing protein [Hymenobacter arizonensis]SFQ80018.1 Superfamily I DNA and RNA helicases [Hymenobacter arizonensis]